jgi:predicted transcriptional regulator of viral defense system
MELTLKGYVIKIKAGYYCWNAGFDDLDDFEIVQAIIPSGVISMFSAAVIHEMTTVNPTGINVTIASRMTKPKLPDYPPVELFFTLNENLDLGMDEV